MKVGCDLVENYLTEPLLKLCLLFCRLPNIEYIPLVFIFLYPYCFQEMMNHGVDHVGLDSLEHRVSEHKTFHNVACRMEALLLLLLVVYSGCV